MDQSSSVQGKGVRLGLHGPLSARPSTLKGFFSQQSPDAVARTSFELSYLVSNHLRLDLFAPMAPTHAFGASLLAQVSVLATERNFGMAIGVWTGLYGATYVDSGGGNTLAIMFIDSESIARLALSVHKFSTDDQLSSVHESRITFGRHATVSSHRREP